MNYISKRAVFSKEDLDKIRYGLVSIYLSLTKIVFILIISIILGIFKEVLIFMVFFNLLRTVGFGLHATKSWICWISSTLVFITIPYLCLNVVINKYFILVICFVSTLLIYKNAPADTAKRPIVSKKRRTIYKALSTTLAIIYSILVVGLNNYFICNCMLFALIVENVLISPLAYKLFKLPYNNYINFIKNHPEFSN
jgi:accessory gene regulator B